MPTEPQPDQVIPVFARWFGSWQISVGRRALDAAQVSARYDAKAVRWDQTLARLGVADGYAAFLRRALRGVPTAPGLRVLDAGIGTGALSLALTRMLPHPFHLDGIDLSSGMLAQAGRRLSSVGIPFRLRQGDITALPYPDQSFDLVMTAHTLEHLADPQTALREFYRVVRPGGLLVVCATRQSAFGAYVQLKWRTHRVSARLGQTWLEKAGFQSVRVFDHGEERALRMLSLGFRGTRLVS